MFNSQDILKTLESIQEQFSNAQEENKNLIFTAKSGGGLVSVSINGSGEVVDITLDDSILEDKESMQILLISAINDALKSFEQNRKTMALDMMNNIGLGGLKGM